MELTKSVKYGTVKWTALSAAIDEASDPDRDPNAHPIPNVTVTFTASTPRIVVQDPSPVTIFLQTITARTNENGVLVGPDGIEGVRLVSVDNVKASPVNFTYRVNISGIGVPITFDIAIRSDEIVDLSFLVPVITSMGKVLVPERGAKGDPGGWVATALGTTQHLDTVTTPGLYFQGSSTAASPTNGYPANMPQDGSSTRGVLEVFNYGGAVIQRYTNVGRGFFANSAQYPRITYSRTSGTIWSNWTAQTSQRVDNTAGKAVYTWDDVANKEQLIYGDTGSRSILLPGTTDQYLYIRRVGSVVELHSTALKPNVVGTTNYANLIPVGFRPPAYRNFQTDPYWSSEDARKWRVSSSGYLDITNLLVDDIINIEAMWTTHEAWPTVLPGNPWAAPI